MTNALLLSLLTLSTTAAPPAAPVRFATFNIWELSREKLDEFDPATGHGTNEQLRNAAAIVQTVRPDVLLVGEIDFDEDGENARRLLTRYFRVGQDGREPIDYPHLVVKPVNTGVPSGLDLNRDGDTTDADDAWGYGSYPGQYGMSLFSRFPVEGDVRTFQNFRWQAMPGHVMPDGNDGRPAWYPEAIAARLPLSSKSHWDVPLNVNGSTIHALASHPTPPVFDGSENRNGRRNFDEIRLWADYVSGGERAEYLVDDAGRQGGLAAAAPFVILGDLNSDPDKGERFEGRPAIAQLLEHPRVHDPRPASRGGVEANPRRDPDVAAVVTSDFGRLDYVLPSNDLPVADSGVFWPPRGEPLADVVANDRRSSDHCLVWVDLTIE